MQSAPESGKGQKYTPAFRLALCGMMAALGTVLMLSSSLIPVLTYAAPMLASLMLIPVLFEFGKKYAGMTWLVTALLALMLCTDREAAFFYLFIGWYPIMKPTLDRIPGKAVRFLVKLAAFTLDFLLLFLLLSFVLGLEDFRSEMLLSAAVYGMLVFSMLLFDKIYERAVILYAVRLRQKLLGKVK